MARERGRACAIRLAAVVDRGRDRGDDAVESGVGHVGSRFWTTDDGRQRTENIECPSSVVRYPLTLNAASAAMLTSWVSLAESGTICTGRSRPTRIGPITVAPPSSRSSLVEIEAEWNAGMMSTLAGPDKRQNG